jgi:hypothetical protein
MRSPLAWTIAAALTLAPVAARADWQGCLLGPGAFDSRCTVTGVPATALAAAAAPVIVAGAAFTIVDELRRRTVEQYPDGTVTNPNQRPSLTLVPVAADRYRDSGNGPRRATPARNPAFEFNETATNVATAIAGAAVLGAIIATVAKH